MCASVGRNLFCCMVLGRGQCCRPSGGPNNSNNNNISSSSGSRNGYTTSDNKYNNKNSINNTKWHFKCQTINCDTNRHNKLLPVPCNCLRGKCLMLSPSLSCSVSLPLALSLTVCLQLKAQLPLWDIVLALFLSDIYHNKLYRTHNYKTN